MISKDVTGDILIRKSEGDGYYHLGSFTKANTEDYPVITIDSGSINLDVLFNTRPFWTEAHKYVWPCLLDTPTGKYKGHVQDANIDTLLETGKVASLVIYIDRKVSIFEHLIEKVRDCIKPFLYSLIEKMS